MEPLRISAWLLWGEIPESRAKRRFDRALLVAPSPSLGKPSTEIQPAKVPGTLTAKEERIIEEPKGRFKTSTMEVREMGK